MNSLPNQNFRKAGTGKLATGEQVEISFLPEKTLAEEEDKMFSWDFNDECLD